MRGALSNFGWLVALVVALVALVVASYTKPAQIVVDPVAESVGLVSRTCPLGWKNVSVNDEHALVKSCENNGWLVVLTEDGEFNYGVQLDTPGAFFITNPEGVPGWP